MEAFYPIFNLSYPIWREELIQELREDDVFYSNDDSFFTEYILNQIFVDCHGCVAHQPSAKNARSRLTPPSA